MAYTAHEGRQTVLDALGRATDSLGVALSAAGAAYEQLDEASGDRLEAELFGPLQSAYAGAQKAHAGFAGRHGMDRSTFVAPEPGPPSTRARGFLDEAVAAIGGAEAALTEAQDTPEYLEVSDQELRGDLASIRESIAPLTDRVHELVRGLGR